MTPDWITYEAKPFSDVEAFCWLDQGKKRLTTSLREMSVAWRWSTTKVRSFLAKGHENGTWFVHKGTKTIIEFKTENATETKDLVLFEVEPKPGPVKKEQPKTVKPKFRPPTKKEVIEHCMSKIGTMDGWVSIEEMQEFAEDCFTYYSRMNWRDRDNVAIKSWRGKLNTRISYWYNDLKKKRTPKPVKGDGQSLIQAVCEKWPKYQDVIIAASECIKANMHLKSIGSLEGSAWMNERTLRTTLLEVCGQEVRDRIHLIPEAEIKA